MTPHLIANKTPSSQPTTSIIPTTDGIVEKATQYVCELNGWMDGRVVAMESN